MRGVHRHPAPFPPVEEEEDLCILEEEEEIDVPLHCPPT